MAHTLTITDLRNMQTNELERDLREKQLHVAKMRIDIDMQSHKDTAEFRREKKQVARILTVLNEKNAGGKALKGSDKTATLSAPATPTKGARAARTPSKK